MVLKPQHLIGCTPEQRADLDAHIAQLVVRSRAQRTAKTEVVQNDAPIMSPFVTARGVGVCV